MKREEPRKLVTRAELAALFRVDPRTVTRWEREGRLAKLTIIRTPGGQLRYYEDEIRKFFLQVQR